MVKEQHCKTGCTCCGVYSGRGVSFLRFNTLPFLPVSVQSANSSSAATAGDSSSLSCSIRTRCILLEKQAALLLRDAAVLQSEFVCNLELMQVWKQLHIEKAAQSTANTKLLLIVAAIKKKRKKKTRFVINCGQVTRPMLLSTR
jgi:hypothetical protein